jgi:hypothetical protein
MGELPARFAERRGQRDADAHEPLGDGQRLDLRRKRKLRVVGALESVFYCLVALRQLLGEHGVGTGRRICRGGLSIDVFHGGSPNIRSADYEAGFTEPDKFAAMAGWRTKSGASRTSSAG